MTSMKILIISLHLLVFYVNVINAKDNPSDGLSFKAPKLDDEESHSNFLPRNQLMRCDACKIIMFRLDGEFTKSNKKLKKANFKLPESELIEIFEQTCHPGAYQDYGVKPVDGVNRLSGPGTGLEEYPALTQSGGKWPTRIADLCGQILEELDELEIYEEWIRSGKSLEKFKTNMCSGSGIKNQCQSMPKQHEDL